MQNTNDRVVMALPWFNLFGQCIGILSMAMLGEYDLSSLRAVASGGAPCPVAVIERMMKTCGCLLWNGFGSNEGYLNVTELGMAPELVSATMGTRQLHSEIKIIDKGGNRLGAGQIGEFCHSGDGACLDEHSYHHFVSRIADIIIRSGMNISAEDVEACCTGIPRSSTPPWWACRPRSRASGSAPISS
jgi:fatty-acyl-CoA synthase